MGERSNMSDKLKLFIKTKDIKEAFNAFVGITDDEIVKLFSTVKLEAKDQDGDEFSVKAKVSKKGETTLVLTNRDYSWYYLAPKKWNVVLTKAEILALVKGQNNKTTIKTLDFVIKVKPNDKKVELEIKDREKFASSVQATK